MIFSRHIITVASLGLIMVAPLPSTMDLITPEAQAQPSRNANKIAKKLKAKNKKKLKELNKGIKNTDRAFATAADNLFRAQDKFLTATGNAQVQASAQVKDARAKYNLVVDQGSGLRAQKLAIILSQHSSRISRFQKVKNRLFNNRNIRLQEAPAPVSFRTAAKNGYAEVPAELQRGNSQNALPSNAARRNGYGQVPAELQRGNSQNALSSNVASRNVYVALKPIRDALNRAGNGDAVPSSTVARNGYVALKPIRDALNQSYSLAPHPRGAGYGSIPSGIRQVSNYGSVPSRVNRRSVELSPLSPDE